MQDTPVRVRARTRGTTVPTHTAAHDRAARRGPRGVPDRTSLGRVYSVLFTSAGPGGAAASVPAAIGVPHSGHRPDTLPVRS